MLLNFKRNGVKKENLKVVYTATIRSVLEYSSNAYHSQLNQHQINILERVQKRSLRAIYGYHYNYDQLLELSGLPTLESRRQIAFEKFANKTLANTKYRSWFPKRTQIRDVRNIRPYLEENAITQRLYRSPLYAMRRYLNDHRPVEPNFDDLSGAFNKP